MKKTSYENVDSYIAGQTAESRPMLEKLRKTILSTVPDAEELIRWNAPFYKYHGFLAGFAAYKNHIRFGTVGSQIDDQMRKTLEEKGYIVLERAVQIRYNQNVPVPELIRILKIKAEINVKTRK